MEYLARIIGRIIGGIIGTIIGLLIRLVSGLFFLIANGVLALFNKKVG